MEHSKTLSLKKDELKETIDISAELEELKELRAEKLARETADAFRLEQETKAASSVTINVPQGKGITLAGVQYLNGRTYQVTNDVKWALEEAQNRCWCHESSLKQPETVGRKRGSYATL
jgi:hypothetical protein